MKNILLYAALLFALIGLYSCEQTVTGVTLPYKEQLVIRAIIEAGKPVQKIKITKTIPPQGESLDSLTWVDDADVIIYNDGAPSKLKNSGMGNYYTDDFMPMPGKTYQLSVKWKDYTCTAETRIPLAPAGYSLVREVKKGKGFYDITYYFVFKPVENDICYITSTQSNYFNSMDTTIVYRFENSIYLNSRADGTGNLKVPVYNFNSVGPDDDIPQNPKIDFFRLELYDMQFYAFFTTQMNGESSNDIFGPSGENPVWNIKGDGFGMFSGRCVVRVPVK